MLTIKGEGKKKERERKGEKPWYSTSLMKACSSCKSFSSKKKSFSSLGYTYTFLRNFQHALNFILLFPFVLVHKHFPAFLPIVLISGNCYRRFHLMDMP